MTVPTRLPFWLPGYSLFWVHFPFKTKEIKLISPHTHTHIRLISRPIHAPNHELEDTDTNTPPAKVTSRRIFVEILSIREESVILSLWGMNPVAYFSCVCVCVCVCVCARACTPLPFFNFETNWRISTKPHTKVTPLLISMPHSFTPAPLILTVPK